MQRLRAYDSLSWHCDQIRLNLRRGDLQLAEAHARAVQGLVKSMYLTRLTQLSQEMPGGYR